MDIRWQGEIYIAAPYDAVYGYLADFARHAEWAQTIERIELIKPGGEDGLGAEYHTFERQGMQSNRGPREPITTGFQLETICEVRELSPSYRIAVHTSKPYDMLDKLRNRINPVILRVQLRAQWEASLRNIKEILETQPQERERAVGDVNEWIDVRGRQRYL